jgi:heme/copper-type cytochrome/quinol oxidase subunit 3
MTSFITKDEDTVAIIEESIAGKPHGDQGPPFFAPPSEPDDDGGGGDYGEERIEARLRNARVGMFVLLVAESMFFAGLIGTFLSFRLGSTVWPPLGQPRLPVLMTTLNTLILLFSSYTMANALWAIRKGDQPGLVSNLQWTALLGVVFLSTQGYEWTRLLRFGLTLSSGIYGATFYTLIGFHGAHVLGAVAWLLTVLWGTKNKHVSAHRYVRVEACAIYWFFVVALWPILFVLVYLY